MPFSNFQGSAAQRNKCSTAKCVYLSRLKCTVSTGPLHNFGRGFGLVNPLGNFIKKSFGNDLKEANLHKVRRKLCSLRKIVHMAKTLDFC